MCVPFSWNQRSPSEPLSSSTVMMLLLVQCLPGCSGAQRARFSVALYFTFATTAVTHPFESGRVLVSSRVRNDSLVDVLAIFVFVVFIFVARFF